MKETRRLIEHIEPQGVKATKTKNGLLLRLPNGDSTVVHYSVSDHRGPAKLRATLRRAGVTWPTDPGKHIQKSKPGKLTQERGLKALEAIGDVPQITTREMALAMGLDAHKNGVQVRRFLLWAGWQPVGNTVSARWIPPLPKDTRDPFPTAEVETAAQLEAVATEETEEAPAAPEETPGAALDAPQAPEEAEQAPEPTPDPEPAAAAPTGPEVREFIDTADSWAADWDAMPDDMTVAQLRQMFALLRLNVELRTWRA
jgi:hypothetical protein